MGSCRPWAEPARRSLTTACSSCRFDGNRWDRLHSWLSAIARTPEVVQRQPRMPPRARGAGCYSGFDCALVSTSTRATEPRGIRVRHQVPLSDRFGKRYAMLLHSWCMTWVDATLTNARAGRPKLLSASVGAMQTPRRNLWRSRHRSQALYRLPTRRPWL